ncbi:ADP-heptose--LPS heptosyltransferase [Shewanella sp. 10N.286.51.B7]|uniref:Glycosyltransferase family 9 protein n=1 Tax=Shewanella electrodiphila TaxID=934143 RepID=A0ABT0KUV1_9GAMM|nr:MULTISPECIES: glycosyltransferase family 9 protein [Shewanella]MCL1047366.1 glycosyltransferase family 9 protein [Shewanella electrodiphila]PMG78673.1 ADP-heptose--LPS heptosyltransferase [Shewanella sp. 10N.286.51.B7]
MPLISTEQLTACKRLLFISPVALGDFLYLKTFLIALKHQYPHIELDIWLDDNRCNDDAWRLSRSKILQQWMEAEGVFNFSYGCTDSAKAMQLNVEQAKSKHYDIIFCHSVSKSRQYSAMAREISASAFIVSSVPKSASYGWLKSIIFRHSNHTFVLDENSLPAAHHITDRYNKIFTEVLGLTLDNNQLMPTLKLPESILPVTQHWLQQKFSAPECQGKLLFLNHLSTNTKKDWHLEQLFELISKIAEKDNTQRFVINVTKENFDEVNDKTASFVATSKLQVAVFTVNEHFFELPSLISQADFVITVDTAILHFAFAAQRPLLAMMRSKKPYWAPPETATSHVMYATEGKGHISDISVERVFNQYIAMNTNS